MIKDNILFLVDGSSLLSSAFYGNLPNIYKFAKTDEEKDSALKKILQTSFGAYTNGVFTMMKQIENLIEKIVPKYFAVAWDLNRETFRREMYDGYKAHRKPTRNELGMQFGISQEILKEMNIPSFVLDGYEADDILGTFAKKFEQDIKVIILTKDQDALQLISDNISVWLITSKAEDMYKDRGINIKDFNIISGVFEYTPITFKEEYNLDPIQMIDKKALEGDASDNIPGVKGVGEKSVVPLLQEFGTVEAIYKYIENTPEKEVKAFIKELGISRSPISYLTKTSDSELCGKASAMLSKELATIKIDIEALKNITLDSLKLNVDKEGKERMYIKYEFHSLIKSKPV